MARRNQCLTQIEIVTGLGAQDAAPAAFQIAEHILVTDAQLPKLRSFALKRLARWSDPAFDPPAEVVPFASVIYAGKGWIANSWRDVECRRARQGYQLRIIGLCTFWISDTGQYVFLVGQEENIPQPLLMQAALGTPFVLALALKHVFSLHVSLAKKGDCYVAFAGESGAGKSTMARFLDSESGNRWRRVVDDMLPVRVRADAEIEALPHYPQLKLGDDDQPIHAAPPTVPLSALYILDRSPDADDVTIAIRSMSRASAALAVIQHTIAARLFDRRLLADHLEFCDFFSAAVPVRRLLYPRRFEQLPLVREAIEADLVNAL